MRTDTHRDKAIELARYDSRAAGVLQAGALSALGPVGAAGIPLELRAPYLVFESHIVRHSRNDARVLDLCCGNGQHSLVAAREGAQVTVSDIAPHNVELTLARAASSGFRLEGVAADAENLPFTSASFDVVTMAGSLSYVELEKLLSEIRRVLRPGGAFIFVDSLDHNPFYRVNRWINFLRGERSLSVLRRIPKLSTLSRIRRDFPDLAVSFHGIAVFLLPLLRPFGPARAACWLEAIDRALPSARRLAFKVVGIGHAR